MKKSHSIFVFLFLFHALAIPAVGDDFARSVDPLPGDSEVTHPFLCNSRGTRCLPGRPYFDSEIHTGLDMKSPHQEPIFENRVVASLPGRLHTLVSDVTCSGPDCESAGNRVAIEHVLDDGDRIFTHYAHMLHLRDDRPATPLEPGDFVPARSVIGYKGKTGSSTGLHLHFEISSESEMSLTYECLPHWIPACSDGRRLSDATGSRVVSDPIPFRNGERRALIPSLARAQEHPEESNRDVYGLSDIDLCASLALTTGVDRTFTEIGVRAERVGGGQSPAVFSLPTERFSAGVGRRLSGCNRLAPGDYHFTATSREFGSGYPVKLAILADPRSVVVDNDQRTEGAYAYSQDLGDAERNVVPGYYRSAVIVRSRSNARASWQPGKPGRYRIWVHLPKGGTAREVRYAIRTRAGDTPIPTAPVDHSSVKNDWILLSAEDGRELFELSSAGGVDLFLARDGARTENGRIPYGAWVGLDAIEFEGVGGADADRSRSRRARDACDPDHEVRGQPSS